MRILSLSYILKEKFAFLIIQKKDLEEKLKYTREILESMKGMLEVKGYNSNLDFDIRENFSEVW